MQISTILKYITGAAEILLIIPFFSLFVNDFIWLRLLYIVFHTITLIFSIKANDGKHGSIMGIIGALIPWFPFFSMGFHFLTGILLIADTQKV